MATSQQPLPQGTQFPVTIKANLNLDRVDENIYPWEAGTPAPHITNTGIFRDDGVTNLYKTVDISTQDQVFYAPNGKKVGISYAEQSVYVDDIRLGSIGPYGLNDRQIVPGGALDMAVTTTGTYLLLNRTTSNTNAEAFDTTTAPGGNWVSTAYGNGVWIAVAATTSTTAGVFRSTDGGLSWTAITTTAPGGNWSSVAYGNGIWVAVAATTSSTAGIAWSSDDGLSWSFVGYPGAAGNLSCVAYGNGVWMATSRSTNTGSSVFRSTSPTTSWSSVTTPTAYYTGWTSIAYGGGYWVAVNKTSTYVRISPYNVANGTTVNIDDGYSTTVTTLTVGSGIAVSTDNGVTWAMDAAPEPNPDWTGVAYGGGVFMATSYQKTTTGIYKSVDNGSTWSTVTTGTPGYRWAGIGYGNGTWSAVADTTSSSAGIARSTNGGSTWAFLTTSAPAGNWIYTAYGGGNWVTLAATTSTTAGVLRTATTQATAYTVQEYDPASETILNSKTLATTFMGAPDAACLVKTHRMTYATSDVAYTWFPGPTTVNVAVFISGTSYTVFSGTGKSQQFTGITAFKNGGTYIVGGVAGNYAMPKSYYAASPYASWTAIDECSYLSNYEDFSTVSAGDLNLVGVPSNLSSSNYTTFATKVVLNSAGTVTPTTITQTGLAVIPGNTYTGFGWGSGKFKSTAATKFSPYILDAGGTPISITETVADYGTIPQAAGSIGSTGQAKAFVYTINGIPSQVVWGGFYGAMPIVEYGVLRSDSPVCQWKDATQFLIAMPTNYGIQVAKVALNTYQMFSISKDVVQLTDSWGTIIDTLTGKLEVNGGGHCPAFVSDIYLTGSELISYQTRYKYSNAVDAGTITTGTGISTTMSAQTITGGVLLPITIYQSASGTQYAKAVYYGISNATAPTDTTVAYIVNPNLPPPVDAYYSGNGIKMVGISALQTLNWSDSDGFAQYYAGYGVSNQLPISYNFFNLFGQLYGFDGQKIYRIPVNGGTVGTPEQAALAQGLTFIANSPQEAWFLSDFDNSLWLFNGGNQLEKWNEMTGKNAVSSGVYVVKEASLFLQLGDHTTLIFRDKLASQLDNEFTNQITYATDKGVYFVNSDTPSTSANWSYATVGNPIPLSFQTGFYGFGKNQMSRITQIDVAFKFFYPITSDVTFIYSWTTADTNGTETAVLDLGSYNVSDTDYVHFQYNPVQALVNGVSIGVQSDSKITVYETTVYYTDGGVQPMTNRLP